VISKNPFARTAYTYSGSPWLLWVSPPIQTYVTLMLLFSRSTIVPALAPAFRVLGLLCAIGTIFSYGALVYYLTHRAQLAANPSKPIRYSWKTVAWSVVIVLLIILGFFLLELFVLHD